MMCQFNNDGFEFPPKHVIWIWIHVRCNPVGGCDEMKMNGECNCSWLFMGQPLYYQNCINVFISWWHKILVVMCACLNNTMIYHREILKKYGLWNIQTLIQTILNGAAQIDWVSLCNMCCVSWTHVCLHVCFAINEHDVSTPTCRHGEGPDPLCKTM